MALPKFLLGDNTDFKDTIYVIHTEYPRFVINLQDDSVTWFENLEGENEADIAEEVTNLISLATAFFDRETARLTAED